MSDKCPKCGAGGVMPQKTGAYRCGSYSELDDFMEHPNCVRRQLATAQEVIDKLPKGGDRKPLYVGMNCFVLDGLEAKIIRDNMGIFRIEISDDCEYFQCHLRSGDGEEWVVDDDDCFTTREAAAAAKEGK